MSSSTSFASDRSSTSTSSRRRLTSSWSIATSIRSRKQRDARPNTSTSSRTFAASARAPLLREIDAVERVAAERRELEVDHFPAHRLQLHRVRDREPRRLLLEDHLRLHVEIGALLLVGQRLRLDDQLVE